MITIQILVFQLFLCFFIGIFSMGIPSEVHGQEIKVVRDFGFALELYEQELYTVAIDAFERFLFNNPDDPHSAEARFLTGKSYMALQRYGEARMSFTDFVARFNSSPLYPDAWNLLAECHNLLGDKEKAAESLEAQADILFAESRYTVSALLRAAGLYDELGRSEKALYLLKRISDTYPDHALFPRAVILLANKYAESGEYLRAIRELSRIEQSDTDDRLKWEARYYNGTYNLKLNLFTKGEEALSSILAEAPADSTIYQNSALLLSQHYLNRGNEEAATKLLTDLANNSSAQSHFRGKANLELGKYYLNAGEYQIARELFETARSQLEREGSAFRVLMYYEGLTYFREDNFPQSFTVLHQIFSENWPGSRTVEQFEPFEYDAFILYIRSATLSGTAIDIALYSGAVLEMGDTFPDAQSFLRWGDIFFDSSIYRTAGDLYEMGYSKYPQKKASDFLLLNRGKTSELLGDYRMAKSLYSRVVSLFPGGEAAHLAAGRSDYLNLKYGGLSNEEILQKRSILLERLSLSNALSGTPDQRLRVALLHGQFNFELREFNKALENFDSIINEGSESDYYIDAVTNSAEIHDTLYRLYTFEDTHERAAGEAQTALDLYRHYLDTSNEQGDYSRFARKRIIPLTLALADSESDKLAFARNFVRGPAVSTEQEVLDFGNLHFANLIIEYSDSLESLQDALNILENLDENSFEDAEKEYILFSKISAASKIPSESRMLLQYCREYMTHYPRGSRAPEVRYTGAETFLKAGDAESARQWLGQLLRDYYYSDYAEKASILMADLLSLEGAVEEAMKMYRLSLQSASIYNNSGIVASLLWKLGILNRNIDNFINAADYFSLYSDAVENVHHKIKGLKELSKTYVQTNNLDAALQVQKRITELDADSAEILDASIEEAFLFYTMADDPSASEYDETLQTAREKFLALLELSLEDSVKARIDYSSIVCLYRLDRRQEANRSRNEFKSRYRFLSDGLINDYMSRLYIEEGLVHQRTAVTMLTSGNVSESEKRFGDAASLFNDVAMRFPGSTGELLAEFYRGLQLVVYQNQIDEGLTILKEFRRKYPDSPFLHQVYAQLGIIQKNLNRHKDAYVSFSIAIETPKGKLDRQTHLNYVASCEFAGFPVAQIDAIQGYLRHFPDAPERMQMLIKIGTLYKGLGQYDTAISHFESIMAEADAESQIVIQYYLGESYFEQKRYTLAIAEFLKLMKYGDPRSTGLPFYTNAQWYTAQSFKEIGDYNNAIAYLDPILSAYGPTDDFYKSARREKETILQLMQLQK